ncbi:DUF971 domain-containing protein [Pseudenhygromyxa sp. WMMC2535]|uniref:DUF971 domain-containing protein n=1 Tax=Pseudenhygromyxa sp. WMMC2535 TaxID=2712867 RepID=UPI0015579D56|nr:DUF971 domain-containing protein [Pseudenhygromyxa sp. WMMC2535]NVB43374.1 DUF971 domain-containing protein [Pseudenhygromyxa sp. WMMC2535]
MARPIDVAHISRENTLSITWEGGVTSVLPVPYLRGWCPCASCQGHSNTVSFHPAPESTRVAALWEVGAYALGVRFEDGHDDGIYSWDWLWKISEHSAPLGPKTGRFVAGRYTP